MKIIKNYAWNVSYQLFIIIVPMITMPYIARVLGPAGVGANSFTNSIAQYFVLFGSVGIALYGSRQIAYVRDSKFAVSQTFWELTFLRFVTILLALIVYFVFLIFYGKYRFYLLLQSVSILAAAFDISWFYMGMENFRVTVLRSLFARIVSLFLIFTLVKGPGDTGIYIMILAASTLLGNLTFFPYLRSFVSFPNFRELHIVRHIRPAIELFIPQIAVQVYVVLNKTMLGSFVNVEASGFYDSSDKILRVVLAVVTGTGTVLLPHIANQFANDKVDQLKRTFKSSMDFVSAISIPLTVGLAAVAQNFVLLFLGDRFRIVGTLLVIESIAGLFIAWDNAIGQQYLLPTLQTSKYTKSVIVGAVVNILFNIPLILLFGVIGAMWATVLSELSVTAVMLWEIRKEFRIWDLFRDCPKLFVAGGAMYLVVYLVGLRLKLCWATLIIQVVVGVVVYGLLCLLLRPRILKTLYKFARRR